MDIRFGIGYDVHQFAQERKLVLGGVEIEYHLGLAGHSDADVLLHSIADAVLGAAGLGDIGRWFPDTDPTYKDASSLLLLTQVCSLIRRDGWCVNNIDAVVAAEQPKLAPFIAEMQTKIATALAVATDRVNVKATTTERLGFVGRQEGIAAYAIASVSKD